jgi:4-amino-4-deoxy-L-arabinose transferase-like glycosyltransferase
MRTIQYIIIALLLYLIFFLRLTSFPIRTWDESWYAVNAYEMMQRHSYFVPYFGGNIDHIITKPMLAVWLQIISIKIFGFNELAIRLPSAMAGAFSSLVVFLFLKKLGKPIWAWCSFLVLITSIGFIHFHAARTGDTDSLLTLFILLSNIFFFLYLFDDPQKNRNIFLYFLFLALAFGVKSFASLLFIPAHIFLLFYKRTWKKTLTHKGTYAGLFIFMGFIFLFIMGRQIHDPDYIHSMIHMDLLRVNSVIDNHKEPFDFYFNNFYEYRFSIWCAVFVFSITLFILNRKDKEIHTLPMWAISLFISQFLFISFSATKLYWYDTPLYPYMAIVTGYGISYIITNIKVLKVKTAYQYFIIPAFFCIPLYFAIKHSHDNIISDNERKAERISEYIYTREREGMNFDNFAVTDNSFIGPMLFYKYNLNEKGQHINIMDTSEIRPNNQVIVKNDTIKEHIRHKFNYTVVDNFHEVTVFKIGTRK